MQWRRRHGNEEAEPRVGSLVVRRGRRGRDGKARRREAETLGRGQHRGPFTSPSSPTTQCSPLWVYPGCPDFHFFMFFPLFLLWITQTLKILLPTHSQLYIYSLLAALDRLPRPYAGCNPTSHDPSHFRRDGQNASPSDPHMECRVLASSHRRGNPPCMLARLSTTSP